MVGLRGLLVGGNDTAVEGHEDRIDALIPGITERRGRHRLWLGQGYTHAAALRPELDDGGAAALLVLRQQQTIDM